MDDTPWRSDGQIVEFSNHCLFTKPPSCVAGYTFLVMAVKKAFCWAVMTNMLWTWSKLATTPNSYCHYYCGSEAWLSRMHDGYYHGCLCFGMQKK